MSQPPWLFRQRPSHGGNKVRHTTQLLLPRRYTMTAGGTIALIASVVFAITLPERHLIPLLPRLDLAIVFEWHPPADRYYDFAIAEFRLAEGGGERVPRDDPFGDGVRPAWCSFWFVTSISLFVAVGPSGSFAIQLNSLLTKFPAIAAIYGTVGLATAPYWLLRSYGLAWRVAGAVFSASLIVYLCFVVSSS